MSLHIELYEMAAEAGSRFLTAELKWGFDRTMVQTVYNPVQDTRKKRVRHKCCDVEQAKYHGYVSLAA